MSKRKIARASKWRLRFLAPTCIIIIIYFIISLLYNTYTIYNLEKEKDTLEITYMHLQEEAEELKIDIEKLGDPEYLANYARENYLYSKNGEYIIQMGEDVKETTQTIDSINTMINKNYIIIGLSSAMVLIFIYILFKGNKKIQSQKKKL